MLRDMETTVSSPSSLLGPQPAFVSLCPWTWIINALPGVCYNRAAAAQKAQGKWEQSLLIHLRFNWQFNILDLINFLIFNMINFFTQGPTGTVARLFGHIWKLATNYWPLTNRISSFVPDSNKIFQAFLEYHVQKDGTPWEHKDRCANIMHPALAISGMET